MLISNVASKNEIYNTKRKDEILNNTDYEDVAILAMEIICNLTRKYMTYGENNTMFGYKDREGKEHWGSISTIKEVLSDLVETKAIANEKDKEIKIESSNDVNINKQLKNIDKKLVEINNKINNKDANKVDQLKYDMRIIKERVDSLLYNSRTNQTKVQDDKKITDLETKVDNYNDNMKKELRELRDSIEIQSESIDKTSKQVNNVPGLMNLLIEKIDNIDTSSITTNKEIKEELEITNPDAKLLSEMYEMSQKLNEMIYQVAISMTSNTEETETTNQGEN